MEGDGENKGRGICHHYIQVLGVLPVGHHKIWGHQVEVVSFLYVLWASIYSFMLWPSLCLVQFMWFVRLFRCSELHSLGIIKECNYLFGVDVGHDIIMQL